MRGFPTRIVHDLRVHDETTSIRRRELISISVEVLGSYSVYLFYLGGRGTVRDNSNNQNPLCRGPPPTIVPRGLPLIRSGGIPLSLTYTLYPIYVTEIAFSMSCLGIFYELLRPCSCSA